MERDTKDELQKAIKEQILDADNSSRISAISVLEQRVDITDESRKFKLDRGWSLPRHYEAWIIVEVPENKDKLYETVMGMTE